MNEDTSIDYPHFLHSLVEAIPSPLLIIDTHMRIQRTNQLATTLLGIKRVS
jgi:PAS domain-containing protein